MRALLLCAFAVVALGCGGNPHKHCSSGFTVEHGWLSACWDDRDRVQAKPAPGRLVLAHADFATLVRAHQFRDYVAARGCELTPRAIGELRRGARDEHFDFAVARFPPEQVEANRARQCERPAAAPAQVVFWLRVVDRR